MLLEVVLCTLHPCITTYTISYKTLIGNYTNFVKGISNETLEKIVCFVKCKCD